MELVWFVRADAEEGTDYDLDKVTWLWHHTTLEDEYIITRNAAGREFKVLRARPLSPGI
jgi:Rieske 2Fe-2S family protein